MADWTERDLTKQFERVRLVAASTRFGTEIEVLQISQLRKSNERTCNGMVARSHLGPPGASKNQSCMGSLCIEFPLLGTRRTLTNRCLPISIYENTV
jgi:hypothetical protein